MNDQDYGDVDDYREPAPPEPDSITALLLEWGSDGCLVVTNEVLWEMLCYHQYMRLCCRTCGLETNGEDGS